MHKELNKLDTFLVSTPIEQRINEDYQKKTAEYLTLLGIHLKYKLSLTKN